MMKPQHIGKHLGDGLGGIEKERRRKWGEKQTNKGSCQLAKISMYIIQDHKRNRGYTQTVQIYKSLIKWLFTKLWEVFRKTNKGSSRPSRSRYHDLRLKGHVRVAAATWRETPDRYCGLRRGGSQGGRWLFSPPTLHSPAGASQELPQLEARGLGDPLMKLTKIRGLGLRVG